MTRRERRPLAEVRSQKRVRQLAGERIEVEGPPRARLGQARGPRGFVLRLVKVEAPYPFPVQHGRVIAACLARRRKLALYQVGEGLFSDGKRAPPPAHGSVE